MSVNEEIKLLVQSKYPLIYYETVDEEYALRQLKEIAHELNLIHYDWSITTGLKKEHGDGPYYQTLEPIKMIKLAMNLINSTNVGEGLFVLKDFDRHLEDTVILRFFKDLINCVRHKKDTIVIVAPQYKIPKDIETDTAHIMGGYPSEEEMRHVIGDILNNLTRYNKKIRVSLSTDEANKIIKALKGLSIQQIRNVITQAALDDNTLNIKDIKLIEDYKKKVFDQEGLLEYCATEDKGNIAGFDNLKTWLDDRSNSFEENAPSSLPAPKGVLLMGVQGCGKSLAVKVIAKQLKIPLYRLDISRLYSSYIGETEQNLRKALNIVEKLSPLCIWIDELEKAFAGSASGREDGGVSKRILGMFLTWMQERKAKCFIAATANDVYSLPPEFLRKGRFDEIFFVDLPDAKTRKELFRIHLSKRGLEPEKLEYDMLAEQAEKFSGAEIEQAIIAALYKTTSQKEELASHHILNQINSTKPLAVLKKEEIARLREWIKERARSV